jgi:NAD(P)H-dependent FMN reductase
VGCVGYGWHGAEYAKSALRQTLERVKMTVVDGPGLAFEKTLTQDGEVRAGEADQLALATMFDELLAKARP